MRYEIYTLQRVHRLAVHTCFILEVDLTSVDHKVDHVQRSDYQLRILALDHSFDDFLKPVAITELPDVLLITSFQEVFQ